MSLDELQEERQFLLGSLRDLEREHESGEMSDRDYAALREDYTARAAKVLRAIQRLEEAPDRRGPAVRGAGRGAPAVGSTRSRRQRVVAASVIAGMAALALASVGLLATDRSGSGGTAGGPTGLAAMLAQAHGLEGQGKALEALKLYDAVIRQDPSNVEALAYRGWLLRLAGLTDAAQESLDLAVSIDPAYPDARFFRGMLLYQDRGDPAGGAREFQAFLAAGPPPETAQPVMAILEKAQAEAAARAPVNPVPPPG